MAKVVILDHPLIHHKLAIMRNKNTGTREFRELVNEVAGLMCYEATRDLPTEEVLVETPITTAKCRMLSGKKLAIVPILRAGLGMVDAMVDLIPSAKIGHIGLYRDLRPMSLWNTTASCPRMWTSAWFSLLTPCWPPVAPLLLPSTS